MKLITDFNTFLTEEVNLNSVRIEKLKGHVESIETFLIDSEWEPNIRRFSAQGSWAHKTIIKPRGDRGFDADFLVFVDNVYNWSAKEYVFSLRRVFADSGIYRDKMTVGTRCVIIDYAGEFNIDVVPCVVNRPGGLSQYEVCNRLEDKFEETDSEAYTAWLHQRNEWVGGDKYTEVTRLLKYLRDIKLTFSCKSILLTTLICQRITFTDTQNRNIYFCDLPTALKTLVGRLDDYLQQNPKMHEVVNPVLPSENFVRHWDDDKYKNFRYVIHRYRGWIEEAFAETDESKSLGKWQRVFGDDFGKRDNRASKELVKLEEINILPALARSSDKMDAVRSVIVGGRHLLNLVPQSVPWMKPAPWRNVLNLQVQIRATVHHNRTGEQLIGYYASGEVTQKGIQIRFEALMANGMLYSAKEFDVQWQVVNSDSDAWSAGGLRGGFYPSNPRAIRWEASLYRGVHWVQAFVIRKRDRSCIGRSERFFVLVE